MSEWNLEAPITVEVQVHVTNGNQVGTVTWGKTGVMLKTEDYQQAINEALEAVAASGGGEWRLLTKREFFNMTMAERTGTDMKFAVPGGPEWEKTDLRLPAISKATGEGE